jgi:sigma-B regulation protein RsbU (phosphoserine phosphatase)
LLLFTDGLNEATNVAGEQYGRKRVAELVCRHRHLPACEILNEVFQSINEFIHGQKLNDDITAVVVKIVA